MTSLCITLLNERDNVEALIDSIRIQTRKPDEVVIVDGGSTDGTIDYLAMQRDIRLIVEPTCNMRCTNSPVARGRNRAIRAAQGHWIIITDAGCVLHPRFIEQMSPKIGGPDVIYGRTIISQDTLTQKAIAIILGESRQSHRAVAFKKSLGGYVEKSLTAEDTLWNAKGIKSRYNPQAIVYWNPPKTVGRFLRQMYRYSKGDAISGTHGKMHTAKLLKWGLFALLVAVAGRENTKDENPFVVSEKWMQPDSSFGYRAFRYTGCGRLLGVEVVTFYDGGALHIGDTLNANEYKIADVREQLGPPRP
jgi:glycosyltransferase involved in cell wall biosynthesis